MDAVTVLTEKRPPNLPQPDVSRLASFIETQPFLKRAVFVVGSGRSGSTLLRSLLDGHPDLIVWPFEFHYYSLFQTFAGRRAGPYKVRDLLPYITAHEFRNLRGYSSDLGGRGYSLEGVDADVFFRTMEEWGDENVNRRDFLLLTIYAYSRALRAAPPPKGWVITINQPTRLLFEDFPGAKLLAAIRHPVSTYVSTKRYYFKAADIAGVDRCAVYRPRAANGSYRLGLLETAVSPIAFTYEWLRDYAGQAAICDVRLERLQAEPERTMREVAEFLGISFDDILLRATIAGQQHGSNLSSGVDSGGRVIADNLIESQQYLRDLTDYEAWWISTFLAIDCESAGYSPGAPGARPGWGELLRPMRHEFPGPEKRESPGKRLARWIAAVPTYVINRWMFLAYSRRDVQKHWPYAH